MLANAGADINAETNLGFTPLFLAFANFNAKRDDGNTKKDVCNTYQFDFLEPLFYEFHRKYGYDRISHSARRSFNCESGIQGTSLSHGLSE